VRGLHNAIFFVTGSFWQTWSRYLAPCIFIRVYKLNLNAPSHEFKCPLRCDAMSAVDTYGRFRRTCRLHHLGKWRCNTRHNIPEGLFIFMNGGLRLHSNTLFPTIWHSFCLTLFVMLLANTKLVSSVSDIHINVIRQLTRCTQRKQTSFTFEPLSLSGSYLSPFH
jgi:hypothetical protein